MRELLRDLLSSLDRDRPCVFCSVVETRGSTPQKAGAAMLVLPDGGQVGTLGGGCIEAEVKQRALGVLAGGQGQPEVLTFCLDDNYGWDDGLICGGRMTILADPLWSPSQAIYYALLRSLMEEGAGCIECVVLADGRRFLFDATGKEAARRAEPGPIPDSVRKGLPDLARRPRPFAREGVAFLPILPRITLLIVGGGHVGQAVARLAAECDFDVWVLDDRESYVSAERFPGAMRRMVGDIGTELKILAPALNSSTYSLIVTRGHHHDEEALYHLAPTACGYVGMIGSRRKIKLIFEDLITRGIAPEKLHAVHAPLGFDVGSQTVPEIAVSIVAELIACRNLGASEPRPRARVMIDGRQP